jgi:hypothetical protein
MSGPLNPYYVSTDSNLTHVAACLKESKDQGNTIKFTDFRAEDNDDEYKNERQFTRRQIRNFFGGSVYKLKQNCGYNSRFVAHCHVTGHGFIHALAAVCHWDFGFWWSKYGYHCS